MPLQRNSKTALEISFIKSNVEEGDSGMEVDLRHHLKVPEEANAYKCAWLSYKIIDRHLSLLLNSLVITFS